MPNLITRSELEDLVATGGVVIVDALPAAYYEKAHLPGALNLVEQDVDRRAPSVLPDKDATIVTYCSNAACGNSEAVARRLERLGYNDVRKYREGIEDWAQAGNAVDGTAA